MLQRTAVTSRFIPHIEFYILELYGREYNDGICLRTDKGNKKLCKNLPPSSRGWSSYQLQSV